jgi:diacylglycerol O-acyltransferase
VSLPVHIDDPLERVRLIARATAIAKEDQAVVGPQLYGRVMAYLPTAFAPKMFRWQAIRADKNSMMNVPVSNVAGPRERGNLGGATVSEIYSTGILSPV